MSRTVSCTGNEFCNLAVVETKERARRVAEYLDENIELDEKIRIHFIGCPNACGQKHIADIGLQGALVKTPDGMVDAFDIAVGGILGPGAKFNEALKGRVKGDDIAGVLATIDYLLQGRPPSWRNLPPIRPSCWSSCIPRKTDCNIGRLIGKEKLLAESYGCRLCRS